MSRSLLPASAKGFVSCIQTYVVLGGKILPWLTDILERAGQPKRHLQGTASQGNCLATLLSSNNATWTLCTINSVQVPGISDDLATLVPIQVEAQVVCVDMVCRDEMAFKLTEKTIEALVRLHECMILTMPQCNTCNRPFKERLAELLANFTQAAHDFVFSTSVGALGSLSKDGTGALWNEHEQAAREATRSLLVSTLPSLHDHSLHLKQQQDFHGAVNIPGRFNPCYLQLWYPSTLFDPRSGVNGHDQRSQDAGVSSGHLRLPYPSELLDDTRHERPGKSNKFEHEIHFDPSGEAVWL